MPLEIRWLQNLSKLHIEMPLKFNLDQIIFNVIMINQNIMLLLANTISEVIIGILKIWKSIVIIKLMLRDYKNIKNCLINEKNYFKFLIFIFYKSLYVKN